MLKDRKSHLFAAIIVLISFGCGNQAPPPVTVYSCNSSAIYNGTPVAPEQLGIPYITVECGACTAVLLTNEWALTATHCYWIDMLFSIRSQLGTGFTSVTPAGGKLPSKCGDFGSDPDLLLVKLQQPFMVNNSTTGYKLDIYDGDPSLVKSVNIYGYGDVCEPNNQGLMLREGVALPVVSATGDYVTVTANSSGQYPLHRDSGGPWFVENTTDLGTTRKLIGISSTIQRGVAGEVDSATALGPAIIKALVQGRVPGF